MTGGNQTSPDDHPARSLNVESLCCTPVTNVIFYVNYTVIKQEQKYSLEKDVSIPKKLTDFLIANNNKGESNKMNNSSRTPQWPAALVLKGHPHDSP